MFFNLLFFQKDHLP